jgi:tetratricopeptide (TPR) repeat protein
MLIAGATAGGGVVLSALAQTPAGETAPAGSPPPAEKAQKVPDILPTSGIVTDIYRTVVSWRLIEFLVAASVLFLAVGVGVVIKARRRSSTREEVRDNKRWESYTDAGTAAFERESFEEAESQLDAALQLAEEFGRHDPRLATSLSNLARIHRARGDYAHAEQLYKRSLAVDEKAFGPDHEEIANSLNNLAQTYRAQRKFSFAQPLYERALEIRERAVGPDHPEVALTLDNLAQVYHAQGRFADAEPLSRRAVAILEKSLGPEHPNVATSLNNLAGMHDDEGHFDEAEDLYKRSLSIYTEALGADHPHVAISLENLAELYRTHGKLAAAEPLYKLSLGVLEKALGEEHPDVATTLDNYAALLRMTGRGNDAANMETRAATIRRRAGGDKA